MPSRQQLRQQMRKQRREIEHAAGTAAAHRLCQGLARTHFFHAARRVAAYLPNDGEIDTQPVIDRAWSAGKAVFVPVLLPAKQLGFAPLTPDSVMRLNRYGIEEPAVKTADLVSPRHLDLVLMPLLAFDIDGNRLGMGGGYYDRSFAFLRHRHSWFRPRLVGLAYDFQRVKQIEMQPWDVRMRRIVTDQAIYQVKESAK